jgi:hypothetical protein
MFNTSNDCFLHSPSSPGLIFNRPQASNRYHPYNRVSNAYYPSVDHESYPFDNNNNNLHHHHVPPPMANYDTSTIPYDYNLAWNTTASTMENEMSIDGQAVFTSATGTTGSVKLAFRFLRVFLLPC